MIISGGPKKKNRDKSSQQQGKESKKARLAQFSKKDNKKVATALEINTQTKKAYDSGLKKNEYGLPAGEQQHKKYNLKRKRAPKFRTTK